MPSFDEIVIGEVDFKDILSKPLKKVLANSDFQLQLLEEGDAEVADADLLMEEIFPRREVNDYKPGQLLSCVDNVLSIICMKGGVVIGSITVSCAVGDEKYMTVHSLAVDKEYRNKKLGSILMLVVHDIACELEINSISLISSNSGKPFYRSFNFTEMAHQSFEVTLPFAKKVINKKIADFQQMNKKAVDTKPANHVAPNQEAPNQAIAKSVIAGLSFFDDGIGKRVQPLASQSLSPTFA